MKLSINSSIKKNLSNINKLSKKKLVKVAKLSFLPEQAKIGPTLAQLGINSMEFCDRFNFQTRGLDKELLIYVRLNVFSDKSFTFSLKQFQLRDLVSSFNLDLSWLQIVSILNKNSIFPSNLHKDKLFEEFLLSFYKAFLVSSLSPEGVNKLNDSRFFIKSLFAYLKSFQ